MPTRLRDRLQSLQTASRSSSPSAARRSGSTLVLGVETSCDETAAAVVCASTGRVYSHVLRSQWSSLSEHGGVFPEIARRQHQLAIEPVMSEALSQANIDPDAPAAGLAAVAVSAGPGLAPCLAVGVRAASQLATKHRIAYIPVNHLEAHALVTRLPTAESGFRSSLRSSDDTILTNLTNRQPLSRSPADDTILARSLPNGVIRDTLPNDATFNQAALTPSFPFLLLLLSGGHCQLLLCDAVGCYTLLGGTLDDSIGEAYDKVARVLGLQQEAYSRAMHPGALLEQVALTGDPAAVDFRLPLCRPPHHRSCDFSFAGLKSSVQRAVRERTLTETEIADLAASFQQTALMHVESRVQNAVLRLNSTRPELSALPLVVSGGVAKNELLRSRLRALVESLDGLSSIVYPPPELCTDNGVMVAWAGCERIR